MRYMIVDTSSILFGLSNRKDVFGAVADDAARLPLISEGVVRELRLIERRKGRNSGYAAAALSLIGAARVEIAKDSSPVDEWIESEARKRGCQVCTNDSALKRKLKRAGITAFRMTRSGSLR